jgi:prephenate dehydratase
VIAGFQGEPGAFSELAIKTLLGRIAAKGYRAFADVLDALERGEIDYAVLPYQNTMHGPIEQVQQLVAARNNIRIAGETAVRVEQCLIAMPGVARRDIARVATHPVAITQCRRFLAKHPLWRIIEADDTAGAVREMMRAKKRSSAAIGPAAAAERYGASVLLRGIQDDPENITRFWLIARA